MLRSGDDSLFVCAAGFVLRLAGAVVSNAAGGSGGGWPGGVRGRFLFAARNLRAEVGEYFRGAGCGIAAARWISFYSDR